MSDTEHYTTLVIVHESEEAAGQHVSEMLERFPMFTGGLPRATSFALGDQVSAIDAVEMALECRVLDAAERIELAQEVIRHTTWEACLETFGAWELGIAEGELVDLRDTEEVSA